jgi:putative SOS response-associated peptidase YedK
MCGRFSITTPWEALKERFEVDIPEDQYQVRYNVAPGQNMWVIPGESPKEARLYHWGLVPHWAKDPKIGNHLINARAETITEKPAFREPFKKHRCLVLADSFYEWDKKGSKKIPYRVMLKVGDPFAFAGICDFWKDESGKEIKSFSIITIAANKLINKIHDRMPVILQKDEERKWIDAKTDIQEAVRMLHPYSANDMQMYQISTAINNPRNDVPQVLKPVS